MKNSFPQAPKHSPQHPNQPRSIVGQLQRMFSAASTQLPLSFQAASYRTPRQQNDPSVDSSAEKPKKG